MSEEMTAAFKRATYFVGRLCRILLMEKDYTREEWDNIRNAIVDQGTPGIGGGLVYLDDEPVRRQLVGFDVGIYDRGFEDGLAAEKRKRATDPGPNPAKTQLDRIEEDAKAIRTQIET